MPFPSIHTITLYIQYKAENTYLEHHGLSLWDGVEEVTGDIVDYTVRRSFLDHLGEIQHGALDVRVGLGDGPRRLSVSTTAVCQRLEPLKEVMALTHDRADPQVVVGFETFGDQRVELRVQGRRGRSSARTYPPCGLPLAP